MDAILTHENADFDALASLLGAKKNYPDALAILPHRLNRNVRDFCALYADALAFTAPDDLSPRKKFNHVLVVDTQGTPSARGIGRDTRIHYLDHHPLTRQLPSGATFHGGDVGATTTLLVEQIQEKQIPLSAIEATLLLLGIYEDTGALTYSDTTARDVTAAAYLLEQNANLREVNEFLHHPLSDAQKKLFQRLIEKIETYTIAGHPIAIAAARANKYVEEVSTLAHQLRELYDPAALFILVQMDDHIQFVARSNHPNIDVGEIAQAFGGGGHSTASAALIRGKDLKKATAKLLKILKASTQPSVTVRELMSYGARTLEPQATVTQAAEMMNKYGHEGFPIAQKGKLVGIVTRRDIDRAIHHQLASAPLKNFMHAPVSVSPDDSLEQLRAVMIESNLGQVPVVVGKQKKILGIVTRTDVIKQSAPPSPSRAKEISTRLDQWLPLELRTLVKNASETARELGYSLYVVGGFVRDLLLNQPNLDLDIVVEGDATLAPGQASGASAGVKLAQMLARKYGGRVHSHARFGTAKWMLVDGAAGKNSSPLTRHLDFTTARTEFYAHPSALPEVERSSIKQDLRRRDFTINTLAICLDPERYGQLLDPFGGEDDLRDGIIRVLHNLSFVEDPTRILRAVRFEQRFGFKMDARTVELLNDALDMLPRVSGERIKHELVLIFRENEPEKALARLHTLGVFKAIHPRLVFTPWHAGKFMEARSAGIAAPQIYFGLLAYKMNALDAKEFSARLKFTNSEGATIQDVIALREETKRLASPRISPSDIYRVLTPHTPDAITAYAIAVDDPRVCERVEMFRARLRDCAPELTGDDLKKMGIPPGPRYREILSQVRDARLDGRVTNRAEEQAMVQTLWKG